MNDKSVLSQLIGETKPLFYSALVVSVLAGMADASLVSMINEILNSTDETRGQWMQGFLIIAVISLATHFGSMVLFERLGHGAQAALRAQVAERVLAAGFQKLEEVGAARVKSALTEHCLNVAEFFVSMPYIVSNAIVVVGCLLYMAILSFPVFIMACVAIGLGGLGYHFVHLKAIAYLDSASDEQDNLFGHFDSLTDGAKELRLNYSKRSTFYEQILGCSIKTVKENRITGMTIFLLASSWGKFLVFAFIGLVMLLVSDDTQLKVAMGFALLFLYMIGPLEGLLMALPKLNFARISASRIAAVSEELVCEEVPACAAPQSFERLELRGIKHRYYHEKSDDFFAMGPIDLQFKAGELVFLVGGNGSGKTSLAKLLLGLYVPEDGQILLDGKGVNNATRDQYRQLFSAVFSDFYLFETLLEDQQTDLDAMGNALIEKLNLQHKVQVRDGAFTSRQLSQGQRKRLALIVAYLEDRPFLMFDEWAADQDPAFKDVFYCELLPELKSQGKTILVISHDDRYFHLADRLLKMEDGKLHSIDTESLSMQGISETFIEKNTPKTPESA